MKYFCTFSAMVYLVPYSMGNITFNVLSPGLLARPGHNDFYNTVELAEFDEGTQDTSPTGGPLLHQSSSPWVQWDM